MPKMKHTNCQKPEYNKINVPVDNSEHFVHFQEYVVYEAKNDSEKKRMEH